MSNIFCYNKVFVKPNVCVLWYKVNNETLFTKKIIYNSISKMVVIQFNDEYI